MDLKYDIKLELKLFGYKMIWKIEIIEEFEILEIKV